MWICLPVLFHDSSNRKAPISWLMNPCDNFMTLHFLLLCAFVSSRDVNLSTFAQERSAFERGLYMLYLQKTSVSKGTTVGLICGWLIPASPLACPRELSRLPFWIYHSDVTLGVITAPSSLSLLSCSSCILCGSQGSEPGSLTCSAGWLGFHYCLSEAWKGESLRLNPWGWAT